LALATPIASLIGVSWLAREGLLFKEAKFIETFAKVNTIVLDKTGTITHGKLSVLKTNCEKLNQEQLNILYSLVDSSTHPVSKAIKKYLEENFEDIIHLDLENIEQVHAKGLQATYKEKNIFGGNKELLQEKSIEIEKEYRTTVYHFGIDDTLVATFELEDTIKEDAKETIEYLLSQNIEVIMCSGDNEQIVSKVAHQVGIENYQAKMSPIDKANYISKLKDDGKIVVMAGDGVNDAIALSRANIAISMGNGADISIAVSDVVILNDSLKGLEKSVYISKRTFNFIKQNLAISLAYNVLTVPIAMAGYVIPLLAALSMSLSSLLVVGNSIRINNKKYKGN
jgi:Cu+-exporting ATPase